MSDKILIVAVNYNSYKQLDGFIESCSKAYSNSECDFELFIKIADNSPIHQSVSYKKYVNINIEVQKKDNLGYFGGAFSIINSLTDLRQYKYVIISNVDFALDKNFFNELLITKYPKNIGWIAPSIISVNEQRDKNPKILSRYSLKQLKILHLLYKYPFLHKLYTRTVYKRKRLRPTYQAQEIYAGHGSLMIFTGESLEKLYPLSYPVFLFGEECFMAEMLAMNGYRVFYNPAIKVVDQEHASTGKMKGNYYYKCNEEAIDYLIKTFYE